MTPALCLERVSLSVMLAVRISLAIARGGSCYCSEVAVVNSALAVALYGADQLAPIDNVAFGGFPLLQEIFYIIAASDKSLTHTKVAEDVDQAFTARP